MLFEISADPKKAEAAIAALGATIETKLGVAHGTLKNLGAASLAAGKDLLYLGGVAAGLAAGALALAKRWADAGTEIFEAAEKTGISAEKLSGLRIAAKENEENFNALAVTMARMGRVIASGLSDPASDAGKTLQGLFKNTEELRTLGLKPAEDQVALVTKKIFELNSTTQQNIQLNTFAGRGYNELRSTLQDLGTGGYDPLIARAKQLNQFFDAEAAARARQFRFEMARMKIEVESLGLAIGASLVPALTQLALLTEVKLQQSLGKNLVQAIRDAGVELGRIQLMLMSAGTSEIFFKDQLDKVEVALAGGKEETQALTDALVKHQAEVQALIEQQKKQQAAGQGAADSQEKAAKATRQLAGDMKDATIIMPPFIKFLTDIERSRADERLRAIAEAIERIKPPQLPFPGGGVPGAREPAIPDLSPSLRRTNETFDQVIARLNVEFPQATSIAGEALESMGLTFEKTAQRFSEGMGQGIAQAILYGRSVGEAMRLALKATVASIGAEAVVRAIYQTAMGFAALASLNFYSAAMHFKSAALFGAVGGAALVVAAAIPGAKAQGPAGAAAGGGATAGQKASPTLAGSAEERSGPIVNVYFSGPVYGGQEGIRELVADISDAVNSSDVQLHATSASLVRARS